MSNWSFMPHCPKCHAHPDMPCGADSSRDPAACPAFKLHAVAIGYFVIADEEPIAPDDGLPNPSPLD